jgi:hypothetical protein
MVCCSVSTENKLKISVNMVNGFVQVERWTSPFKILRMIKDALHTNDPP